MFEAFYTLVPDRCGDGNRYESIGCSFQYPTDIEKISKSVRDVREFAYADLDQVRLQALPEEIPCETYSFIIGREFYGICLRCLGPGAGGGIRYDVGRRVRLCFVIVTRHPFHQFFQCILHQIRGMTLLYKNSTPHIRVLLAELYQIKASGSTKISSTRLKIPDTVKRDSQHYRDASLSSLFLLEVLDLEQFMYLFSALLLEHRVIVTASEVSRLSNAVVACVDMLFPFKWQHVYIPLLPKDRVAYLNAPMPFVIGVKQQHFDSIDLSFVDEVVIFDADEGSLQTLGDVDVLGLIGDSGTVMRQASEGIAQLKNKMGQSIATFVKGGGTNFKQPRESSAEINSTTDTFDASGPVRKDIITAMFSELRPLMAAKPDDSFGACASVASAEVNQGILGARIDLRKLSLAGKAFIGKIGIDHGNLSGSKNEASSTGTNTGSDIQAWRARGEKCVRNNLLLFFLYLFADLDDFYRPNTTMQDIKSRSKDEKKAKRRISGGMKAFDEKIDELARGTAFATSDSRSSFDLAAFLLKKKSATVGLSNELLLFLQEFIHSQLFEQHCESRRKSLESRDRQESLESRDRQESSLYDLTVAKLRERSVGGSTLVTISGIKEAIAVISTSMSIIASNHYGGIGSGGHPLISNFVCLGGEVPRKEERAGMDSAFYLVSTGMDAEIGSETNDTGISINRDLGLERIQPSVMAMQIPPATDLHADMTVFSEEQYLNSTNEEHCMLFELCEDAHDLGNDCGLVDIVRAVEVKLVECLRAGLRGDAGRSGARALIILQALLLFGPEAVLSLSLELVTLLRAMCATHASPHSCIERIEAFDFLDDGLTLGCLAKDRENFYGGASDRVKVEATVVLDLLLDHASLAVKRRSRKCTPWHGYGRYASTHGRIAHDSPLMLSFSSIHASLRPEGLAMGKPCSLILRRQSLQDTHDVEGGEESEDDDDCEEDKLGASYTILSQASFQSSSQTILLSDDDSFTPSIPAEVKTENLKQVEAKIVALYKTNLPEKVTSVSSLMKKYKGREYEMLAKLEEKFGPAPSFQHSADNEERTRRRSITERSVAARTQLSSLVTDVSSASLALVANVGRRGSGNSSEFGEMIRRRSGGGVSSGNQEDLAAIEDKMMAIYRVHLPSKVDDMPRLLKKYRGREQEMLRKLEERFGQAPLPTKESPLAAVFAPAVEEATGSSTLDKIGNPFDRLVDLSKLGSTLEEKSSKS